jgi:hypothetical protein
VLEPSRSLYAVDLEFASCFYTTAQPVVSVSIEADTDSGDVGTYLGPAKTSNCWAAIHFRDCHVLVKGSSATWIYSLKRP